MYIVYDYAIMMLSAITFIRDYLLDLISLFLFKQYVLTEAIEKELNLKNQHLNRLASKHKISVCINYLIIAEL